MARKKNRNGGRNRTAPARKKSAAAAIPTQFAEDKWVENCILGGLLSLLAVLVFIPVFNAGFIWDDDQLLTGNLQVHAPDGWWTLWLRPQTADYFPLTSTTLWLEYHLGHFFSLWNLDYLQRNAAAGVWSGYHIMNVLFHATAVVLTWQTLKRLRVPGAWVAAAIFAVHPVCVESVAWISERKNTISQIFFLLAILKYLRFEEQGRLRTYAWALICFTLALLAKTSVVMLPFILLLLAWWRSEALEPLRASYDLEENPSERGILFWSCLAGGAVVGGMAAVFSALLGVAGALAGAGLGYVAWKQLRKASPWNSFAGFEVIRILPFLLVAFVLGVVTVHFQYGRAIGGEEIPLGSWWQRIASACFAVGFYLYSAFWPFNLIEIYPQWHRAFSMAVTVPSSHIIPPAPESIPYYLQVLPGLLIAGMLTFCWMRRRESWARALLVGLGCYIVAMLPALGLLKMSYMRLTLVADHFQYISIVAVIALVVAAGATWAMKPLWLGLASLFFVVITVANWGQTPDNHAFELIWIAGAIALAVAAAMKNAWKYVWGGFVAAVLVCSSIVSFMQAGVYHSEQTLWSATLARNPNTWQGQNHLGATLYTQGDVKDAYQHFATAVRLKPENPECHNNLGLTLTRFGHIDEAIQQFEMAASIKEDSGTDTNLANAYASERRFDEAIRAYKRAINLDVDNISAHCNLGVMLMQQGRVDEAIPEFMKIVEIAPQMPQGRGLLVQALRMKGINLDAPDMTRPYGFNLQRAIELLRSGTLPSVDKDEG